MIKKSGGILACGFSIKMPYNYISFSGSLQNIAVEKKQKMFNACKLKLEIINEYVSIKKEGKLERSSNLILLLVGLLGLRVKLGKPHYQTKAGFFKPTKLPFSEILPLMDKSFQYDDTCNGCGICSKICPVNNIKMDYNKPLWQHHCEQCFACLQWCPKEAIQFGIKTKDGKRYHNPEVKLTDMFKQ
jgi:ferredoxin